MKSLTRMIAMAAAIAATAGVLGANAAEELQQPQVTAQATHSTRTPKQTAQLEFFQQQESILDAPSYDPAEHPNAKPAPHSAHRPRSIFDDPVNTLSPGN